MTIVLGGSMRRVPKAPVEIEEQTPLERTGRNLFLAWDARTLQ